MSEQRRVFLFGASGHAKVVVDAVLRSGCYSLVGIVDDDQHRWGTSVGGVQVMGGRDAIPRLRAEGKVEAIVAIGDNRTRVAIAAWIRNCGIALASVVHPASTVGYGVQIGQGTVIMAGATVNPDARIGDNVIINTGAIVEHDCVIGDGVHIAPGCRLCGHVQVGAGTLLGAGTVVIPSVRIGSGTVIGAGSTVVQDVPDGAQGMGTPFRTARAE